MFYIPIKTDTEGHPPPSVEAKGLPVMPSAAVAILET